MNKYSKRALKTTATVGMSLAMVLSAVSAPVSATADKLVCTVEKVYSTKTPTFTKEINGIISSSVPLKDVFDTLTALEKEGTVSFKTATGSEKVEAKLQATLKDATLEDVASDLTFDSVTFADANFQYVYIYTGEDITYLDVNSVQRVLEKDHQVPGTLVELSTLGRTATDITADVKKVVNEGLEFKLDDNWVGTKTEEITDKDGKEADVVLNATFQVAGVDGKYGDAILTEPKEADFTDSTKVLVTVTPESDAIDYNCDTTQIGAGLPAETSQEARNVYNQIVKDFTSAKTSLEDIKVGDEVTFKNTLTTPLGTKTILTTNAAGDVVMDLDFKATLYNISRVIDEKSDEGIAVDRFYKIETAMKDMFKADGTLATALTYKEDHEFKTTADYAKAVDLLEEFADFETYLTNLSTADNDKVVDARENLQNLVDGYVAENDGDLIDAYLTNLDKFYEKFVDEHGEAGITKANVDSAIKAIKNGTTFTDLKNKDRVLLKSDYTTFKDNAGVSEYMTKFEDMYEEITAVKDAVSKTNDAYKALVKGTPSVKAFLTNKDSDRKLSSENPFGTVKSNITVEEYNILKDYKEEVLDVVFTMTSKEVGNSFVNKSEKSMFATKAQLTSVLANLGVVTDSEKALFTKLDKETGEFNWDKLVAHMDKVVSNYAALTTGIEKLDSITLVTGDRAAILAADEAVYFLQGSGANNLTSAETRIVKNAERKVDELMDAYRLKFGSLNVEVNGWVNKGNGDWAYYEKGNAPTKWVAAGTNWFYVKDGVMLRNSWVANNSLGSKWYYVNNEGQMVSNTTVNGYTFDVNGVWVENPTTKTVTEVKNEVIYENTLGEGDYVPEY